MDVAFHECIFECATTAWISADAFISERIDFRKPAITTCLEIASAGALLGRALLEEKNDQLIRDFQKKLESGVEILNQHASDAEHCLITLKCWRQTAQFISK